MSSRQAKGKKVAESSSRKRKVASDKVPAAPPVPQGQKRKYGFKAVTAKGKHWYLTNKDSRYFSDGYVDEDSLAKEFPRIWHRIKELGMNFIFQEPTECNLHTVRELYANWDVRVRSHTVMVRGAEVLLTPYSLNAFLEAPTAADPHVLNQLIITPPYADIRHVLCSRQSTARWGRHASKGYHSNFPYAQMNREARVWLKIVCLCLIPAIHMTAVTRDRVCLVYALMTGKEINAGAVIKSAMKRAKLHSGNRYGFGGLLTKLMRESEVPEEALDYYPPLATEPVDVTKTKGAETHGPSLTLAERHVRDDGITARMFGLEMLRHRTGGRPSTAEELREVELQYPLNEHAMAMLRLGPAFVEPIDDDVPTDGENQIAGSDKDDKEEEEEEVPLAVDDAEEDMKSD